MSWPAKLHEHHVDLNIVRRISFYEVKPLCASLARCHFPRLSIDRPRLFLLTGFPARRKFKRGLNGLILVQKTCFLHFHPSIANRKNCKPLFAIVGLSVGREVGPYATGLCFWSTLRFLEVGSTSMHATERQNTKA